LARTVLREVRVKFVKRQELLVFEGSWAHFSTYTRRTTSSMSSLSKHIDISPLKEAEKSVWVKCIRGISPSTNLTTAKKATKVMNDIAPHLKEGHIKLTVKKNTSFKLIEAVLSLFSDAQRYFAKFTITTLAT
jgi:hypothetical protein